MNDQKKVETIRKCMSQISYILDDGFHECESDIYLTVKRVWDAAKEEQ